MSLPQIILTDLPHISFLFYNYYPLLKFKRSLRTNLLFSQSQCSALTFFNALNTCQDFEHILILHSILCNTHWRQEDRWLLFLGYSLRIWNRQTVVEQLRCIYCLLSLFTEFLWRTVNNMRTLSFYDRNNRKNKSSSIPLFKSPTRTCLL